MTCPSPRVDVSRELTRPALAPRTLWRSSVGFYEFFPDGGSPPRGPEQIENEHRFLKLVDISDTSSDSSGTHLLALCVEKCIMSPGGVFLTAPGGLVLKGCAGGVSDSGGLSSPLLLNVG